MARPIKHGLDYFPFDVDFFNDEKIIAIAGEFGIKGEITTIKLLCAVYRNGYFIEWNEMLKFKLLKELPGVSADLLDQIIKRLVKWDFFDKTLFDSASILTSAGIQRRYQTISTKMHRKNTITDYCLIDAPLHGEAVPNPIGRRFPTSGPSAQPPVSLKTNPTPLEESIATMLSDTTWNEPVCIRYKLSPEQFKQKVANFRLHCLSREKREHEDVTDAKRHFCNLLSQGKLDNVPLPPDSPSAHPPVSPSAPPPKESPDQARFRRLIPSRAGKLIMSYAQYQALGLDRRSDAEVADYCAQVLDGKIRVPSILDLLK